MRIDPTIYQAIDDGRLTIDQVLASMMQVVLEVVAADCIAKGFDEADVMLKIEELRKTRPAALDTLRQMLQSRTISSQ